MSSQYSTVKQLDIELNYKLCINVYCNDMYKLKYVLISELTIRAGNLLIGFPSESLVFFPKMSE